MSDGDVSNDDGGGDFGTILFPGSPWSRGHRIVEAHWRARLRADGALVFHLHLRTADYETFPRDDGRSDDDDDVEAWRSTAVWGNYHRATLSSDFWDGNGFVVGSAEAPLQLAKLGDTTFNVDPDPLALDDDDLAFNIYLLGHDTVGDHAIRFVPTASPTAFDIDWRGKIALTYGGDDRLAYTFVATLPAVPLQQVSVVGDHADADAAKRALLAVLVLPAGVDIVADEEEEEEEEEGDDNSDDVVYVFRLVTSGA